MKIKIKKDIILANPTVSEPHWEFKRGETIETEDNYLINRLKELNIIDKEIFENKMVNIEYVPKKRGRSKTKWEIKTK